VKSRASYVSGPPAFVHVVRGLLRKAQVASVKTDFFSGYTSKSTLTRHAEASAEPVKATSK
jgi:hypothetical protein